MLLLYDAIKVRAMLKKTEALMRVKDFLFGALDGVMSMRIESMQVGERFVEDIDFGIKAICECYQTKPFEGAFFESHCAYVDFQLIISGTEMFAVGDIDSFEEKESYNEEKDLIVYEAPAFEEATFINLKPRSLAVFFPEDIHAGGLHLKESQKIQKCVLKVPVDLLKFSF